MKKLSVLVLLSLGMSAIAAQPSKYKINFEVIKNEKVINTGNILFNENQPATLTHETTNDTMKFTVNAKKDKNSKDLDLDVAWSAIYKENNNESDIFKQHMKTSLNKTEEVSFVNKHNTKWKIKFKTSEIK